MKTQLYNRLLFLAVLAFFAQSVIAQNPSMTIQHSGYTPNDTLWVAPGDSIDFIYGGGGNHPMTSGHGNTPSPVFFPTVTVNSTTPLATFALTTIGTYLFHCGTNPTHQELWGTIIVQEANAVSPQVADDARLMLYPNPCTTLLHLSGKLGSAATYAIHDLSGKVLLQGKMENGNASINVSMLAKGLYVAKIDAEAGSTAKVFSKK